ncbi:FHA domain-containing protein [Alishewanella tabrizica]|uniref:FHA domain-containing protein n=1 Tax=Alishewanella tabrizica TaxID=671278 RepID=A0ABQ2WXK1_9ALTE|nr:FHA domain-containing protein [Alishewanella tabrizica]GGW73367.1 hypothetical protein GCM10008111_31700 [Alishewanella tabrizica]
MSFRLGPDGKPVEVETSFAPAQPKPADGGTLPPRCGFNAPPTGAAPGAERTQPPAVDLFQHIPPAMQQNAMRPGGMAVMPEPPTRVVDAAKPQFAAAAPVQQAAGGASVPEMSAEPKTSINFGAAGDTAASYVCGWLVVVDGPGKGKSLNVCAGQSAISRSVTERIVLNFGDTSITSKQQLLVIFDDENRDFIIAPGNGSSLNRLNGQIVAGQMQLKSGDILKVGATTLRFVAFCDASFSWQ